MTLDALNRSSWPDVLLRAEVAAIFRCHPRQLDKLRRLGLVPRPMFGGGKGGARPQWSKADIIRWLDSPSARHGIRRTA